MKYTPLALLAFVAACATHEPPKDCEYDEYLHTGRVCIGSSKDEPTYSTATTAKRQQSSAPTVTVTVDDTNMQPPASTGGLKTGCNGRKCAAGSGRGNSEGNENSQQDND